MLVLYKKDIFNNFIQHTDVLTILIAVACNFLQSSYAENQRIQNGYAVRRTLRE